MTSLIAHQGDCSSFFDVNCFTLTKIVSIFLWLGNNINAMDINVIVGVFKHVCIYN